MKCIMEQSLWFTDIETDRCDYPKCDVRYINSIENMTHISEQYNLYDIGYGMNRYIYLSELLKIYDKSEWDDLMKLVSECDMITVINDVSPNNSEMVFINDFYIKVFCCQLNKYCTECYVYGSKKSA